MPYSNLPEDKWGKMDSCVEQVLKKDPSLTEQQAIAICYENVKEWAEKYGTSEGAMLGHANQGHDVSGSAGGGGGDTGGGSGGSGGGGRSSGGRSSRGYASARDEWSAVNRRLAAGGLKKGERKLLEARAERLAQEILGVGKEYDMSKQRQLRKERQRARSMALESKEAEDGLPPEEVLVIEEKEQGEKCDTPMAMSDMVGGSTSWDELDAYMQAHETSEALQDLNMHFQAMVSNVLYDLDVEDKAAAIASLADGLKKRLGKPMTMKEVDEKAVTKSEQDGDHPASHYLVVEDSQKPTTWHLMVKDMQGKADSRLMGAAHAALMSPGGHRGNKYEGPGKSEAISKLKAMYKSMDMTWPEDKKGFAEWVGEKVSEVARIFEQAPEFESIDAPTTLAALKSAEGRPMLMLHTTNAFKDRDGEIFMDKALQEYADKAQPGTPVDFWHTPWTPGRVTWTAYSEKALFELVEASADKASEELFNLISQNPTDWGCSHRFYYAPKERANGVFSQLNKTRSTLLPLHAAANPYTAVGALTKEADMLAQEKLAELKGKLSPEAYTLAEGFIKSEEQKSAALVEAGIEHKEAKVETAAPAPAPEIAALQTKVEGLMTEMATLVKQNKELEAKVEAEKQAREKAALEPRGASFFTGIPASRDPATALPDSVLPNVGPGNKALQGDPMIESLKALGLVTQKQ